MTARKRAALEKQLSVAKLDTNTPFRIAEAYKTVRTNLLFAMSAQSSKTVVISSPVPSEGKSVTCANLAITMAQTGARVLLIDCDLRNPTQYKIFRCQYLKGLTTLLAGFDSMDDVLFENVEPNLDLITSGPIPPNPSELLSSENMSKLLETLNETYDYLFLDTPPINVVTDAMVLAKKAAGVVLVNRQGQSTHNELTKTLSALEFSEAKILGLVINGSKEKSSSGYGGYKYGYGSYGAK